ncbi:hypothetical protein V8C26DRAFT_388710 [Trichoderma gracile]
MSSRFYKTFFFLSAASFGLGIFRTRCRGSMLRRQCIGKSYNLFNSDMAKVYQTVSANRLLKVRAQPRAERQ